MHEMGIASSLFDAVRQEAARFPGGHITRIGVRIGPFAGVNFDSLSFCFDALVPESGAAPLELALQPGVQDELEIAFLEVDDGNDPDRAPGPE